MRTYTIWRKTAANTYEHVADTAALSAERAWREASKSEPVGTRLVITAEGDKPPGLLAGSAAGLCEGVTGNGYLPESLLSRAEINIDDLAKAMTTLVAEASNEQMLAAIREFAEGAEKALSAAQEIYKSIDWEALIEAARLVNQPEEGEHESS